MVVGDSPKFTVRYAGDKLDSRQVDGKLWFAVDGKAVLTRAQHLQREIAPQFKPRCTQGNVTASLHVVLGASSPGEEGDPAAEEGRDSQATPPRGPSALLLRAAQASPAFAALTALPPGVHVLCYLPPSEAADRLTWVESCLHLLEGAAGRPEFMATLPAPLLYLPARRGKGWALVPCAPSNNLICVLARGSWKGDGGRVAWFHSTEAGEPALADDLLLTSIGTTLEPAYASISARRSGNSEVEVVAEAHRVLTGGLLSGYDVGLTDQNRREPSEEDGAVFLDDSAARPDGGRSWGGTVTTEELPGGGLHRHVRVKIDASCAGKACDVSSGEGAQAGNDFEWCDVLLAQHLPQGAYIDVDEVKARHDFDVRSSFPADRRVGVETFEGEPIDIELPSSVSGQHLVNFNLRVDLSERDRERREGTPGIRAEVTLPVHLRYPDPGCERRGEDCEEYAWVEVPPPLASIRCGSATGTGAFHPVLPLLPPAGVGLRVPRGIAWHRDVVMWGTVIAAALGCAYTVRTLVSAMSMCAAPDPSKKRR